MSEAIAVQRPLQFAGMTSECFQGREPIQHESYMTIFGIPDLINRGLHVPGVCRGHGLQSNWVLTSHFNVSNLQQASGMLLGKLDGTYFSTLKHV